MISKEMAKALNEQINKEVYSAYLYQSMSAHSDFIGLKGFANWFSIQVQEELFHAKKFYHYILEQGEKIELASIDKPDNDFKSAKDMFERTLEHEKKVTASINTLAALAQKENDYATFAFLQWFISEQVEEEASANDILGQLNLAGEGSGLFMIDKDLAARVFNPPAAE
jgi:ferritin